MASLTAHARLWFLVSCLALSACGLKTGDGLKTSLPDVHVPSRPTTDQIKAALHAIFPSLSDEELASFSASLDLDAVLALKVEIDDIRRVAGTLSKALASLGADRANQRSSDLEAQNGGFPTGLEAVGRAAYYTSSQATARIELCGVYHDHEAVQLSSGDVSVSVDGAAQSVSLDCVPQTPVDIVLLVDITGSMSPVIGAVRRSLAAFVAAIVARHVEGTLSVVTFQDSVGVNVDFQARAPANGFERSPFFKPVAIDDETGVAALSRFIARLEANSGADTPENLAGALDFARNNVIGLTSSGKPNVIGDGVEDPASVSAWPALENDKQIFVAITDAPFHADSRTPQNSSLKAAFKPRHIADILTSLQVNGTTVHVSDPSWVDGTTSPIGTSTEVSVDSDYWAMHTGGLGEDRVGGYSLVDLDLLVVAEEKGLLDILLDGLVATSCTARFSLPTLSANATFELQINAGGETFHTSLTPTRL